MHVSLTDKLSDKDLVLLERIYTDSFPEDERRPWDDVANPPQAGCPALFAIIADGHIRGLATLWVFDTFSYIEHLALDRTFRSQGIGSAALQDLIAICDPKPIVLEAETPDDRDPMTRRRIDFYKRHGFNVIDREYVQPPYAPGLSSVRLYLMSTAPIHPASTAETLHREVYGGITR